MNNTTTNDIPPLVRFALRTVYTAGFAGTGYGLWDLLTAANFNAYAALGIVAIVELFGVTSSTYSTRARLRGDGGFFMRNVVAMGTLTSAGAQLLFHWDDNRVQAALLPVASLLALTLWVLDVNDRHARVFARQRQERQQRRKAYGKVALFAYANGVRETHAQWKQRTVNVGTAERAVRESLELGALEDALTDDVMSVAPVTVPIVATVMPPKAPTFVLAPPLVNVRGAAGRPMSPAPADTVIGDDVHAQIMRQCRTATDAVRYAWTVWGADASPTALVKWLEGYGVSISRAAVSVKRPKVQIGA